MNVQVRDNRTDGAALIRIARELRAVLLNDCEACKRGLPPREQVEGSDPPKYVHWYPGSKGPQSTCAPCLSDAQPDVLADVAKVEEIGVWLWGATPIVLPISLQTGPAVICGNVKLSSPTAAGLP